MQKFKVGDVVEFVEDYFSWFKKGDLAVINQVGDVDFETNARQLLHFKDKPPGSGVFDYRVKLYKNPKVKGWIAFFHSEIGRAARVENVVHASEEQARAWTENLMRTRGRYQFIEIEYDALPSGVAKGVSLDDDEI